MKSGDAEANYAYYTLVKFNRFPGELFSRPWYERQAIYAFIDEKVRQDRTESAKIRRTRRR